ncbi:MAG: beta-ketoacyl-[acyl-carrier-protein] synthase family protein [Deltaproteobacteria bacterium]|nr:MAG: beta-ketoacyl-[acyl-carrier-protein] synthase family protein [Deltaproteobacteria bacterium]
MGGAAALITGLGLISAAGGSLPATLASLERGERRAGPVTLFPTTLAVPVFEVPALPGADALPGQRTLALTLAALAEALAEARLGEAGSLRVGVCIGTTVASQLNDLQFYKRYRETGTAPLAAAERFLKGNLAQCVARRIGARGPALTVVNACSSGTDAVGVALAWLKGGLCDLVIAGGADELSHIPLCGFHSLGIVNPGLCAPFDRERKGLNLGEGAGLLVIETPESARRRGVAAELSVAGFGAQGDAYHLTAPSPDGVGLRAALRTALAEAAITPAEVAFVNAHGTGTHDNDLVEGTVLAELFGPAVKVLSTKGYTGHTLGAAGGIEAVLTAAALRAGWIPASAGFACRDEAIPLAPVTARTPVSGRYAVSTSLAFGGNNAALVIGREVAPC